MTRHSDLAGPHDFLQCCKRHVFNNTGQEQLHEPAQLAPGRHDHFALARIHAVDDEAGAFLHAHRIVFFQAAGARRFTLCIEPAMANLGRERPS